MAADPRRAAVLALAVTLLAAGGGAESRPPGVAEIDPARISWTRLRFEARKLFLRGTTEVSLVTGRRRDFEGQLIRSPRSVALEPRGRQISLLGLESSIAGRRSEIAVWFDPDELLALQSRKLRHGKKAYEKTYRFTRGGIFSHRRAPVSSAEAGRPPGGWGKIEETFYPHPGKHPGCSAIVEPTMLLYLVAAAEPAGEPMSLCAFSNKVLTRVELLPNGFVPLEVDYDEILAPGRTRRRGQIEALRITVTARPFGQAGGDFELLGLEGDIELFVDRGVPVEVAGRLPGFGRVRVRLTEVELRQVIR